MSHKIILIDDESYVLDQLKLLLDWEKLGFEIVGSFSSTQNIFEYIDTNEVDAILSDISMPYPNGLDIAKYCYEKHKNIFVVLLSGFRDFKYAQQAIQYKTFEYLTKPISYDKFVDCILRLSLEITSNKEAKLTTSSFGDLNSLFIMQTLFSAFSNGEKIDLEEFCWMLTSHYGIPSERLTEKCALVDVHIPELLKFLKLKWKYKKSNLYTAICNLILCESEISFNIPVNHNGDIITVLIIKKSDMDFENILKCQTERICENIKNIFNLNAETHNIKIYSDVESIQNRSKSDDNNISEISNLHSDDEIINNIYSYIKENYKKEITLDMVCKHTAMSKSRFCSYFKTHTEQSFITVLNKYRISKALSLLKNKQYKPSSVSYMVGFSNPQHFYRIFKSCTNMTPGEYQYKVTNNDENNE